MSKYAGKHIYFSSMWRPQLIMLAHICPDSILHHSIFYVGYRVYESPVLTASCDLTWATRRTNGQNSIQRDAQSLP